MRRLAVACCFFLLLAWTAPAEKLTIPPEATEGLKLLYSGEPDTAINHFRSLQRAHPQHPLGYLLEANAVWWKIYCAACEVKYNIIDAWKQPRGPLDDDFLHLTDKAIQLAEGQMARKETAEMRLYAGMGYALKARLLGLRDERRATARAGVKAREHLLRANALDPDLADAYTGLGLYNYYVDTLSAFARILRFFMGIPGGSKKEGVRQLEIAARDGQLTAVEARIYLAKNLRNYDQQYERSVEWMQPLTELYPRNPLFHLLLGDMNAKLSRNEKAAASYRAAQQLSVADAACQARVQHLAQSALAALPPERKAQNASTDQR